MRTLHLDFAAPNQPRWPGMLVLAAALLLACVVWQAYTSTQTREHLQRLQLAEARKLTGREQQAMPRAATTPQTLLAMQQARAAAVFLQIPWDQLFTGLETASAPGVALLAIEPDAKKSQVKITAEANSKDALFDYIKQLEATPQFDQVLLLKHERQMASEQQPLRFIISAHWQPTVSSP